MKGRVIGIDLGTSNSVAAAVVNGEALVIPDGDAGRVIPTVVSFLPDGRKAVGRQAKSRMAIDPLNTVYSAKRLIGRPFYAPEIKLALEKYAYQIVQGEDQNPKIQLRGQQYSIEEIQAIALQRIRQLAEDFLGEAVTRAVITVPANFNEAQREATKVAGELAGLEVLRILNEPTAAALAYGYEQQLRERIAVYDLGGGTFDITILELRDNVFEVLATAGDTFLGGDDLDHRVAQLIVEDFKAQFGFDMATAPGAVQRLKGVAERIKTTLTDAPSAHAVIKQLVPGESSPSQLDFTLSRERFNEIASSLVQQTFVVCDEALKIAGLTSAEIDRLVLVGGSTRSPIVRQMVENYFFRKPLTDINPDEVVAVGAAIYAFGLEEAELPPEPLFDPLLSADLMAVESDSFSMPAIPGAAVPGKAAPGRAHATNATLRFGSADLPPLPGSDPLQAQASASQTLQRPAAPPPPRRPAAPLLIDVTPNALGIQTIGGFVDVLIERNTALPARNTRQFATSVDNQTIVRLNILGGESREAANNRQLGEVVLYDIRPAPRGQVRIDVTFELDVDGILGVTARDVVTNQVQRALLSVAGISKAPVASGNTEHLPAPRF